MKKQISVVIAIAVLMLSTFAALKLAYAQVPSIELVEPDIVTPPPGATGYFFDVEVWLNYAVGVAAWEAVVYWDPSVMTRFRVTFENTMGGTLDNYTKGSMGGENVRLGQMRTDGGTYTGTGHVATIEMIYKYPGASRIYIFNSTLLNSGLEPITHTTIESTVKTNHPAPSFYWYATEPDGVTPASALPEHYLYDDCQNIQVYKIIWFDASASYDVCNLVYNPVTHEWELVGGKDIVEYMWWFGDGYTSNDIRLYNSFLPMGVPVRAADPDVGRPMVHFLENELHDEMIMVNGMYDAMGLGPAPGGMWEGVYVDLFNATGAPEPNGMVDIGDMRKTPSSMFPGLPASTPVMPLDADIGLELVPFDFYEKHTEGYWGEPGMLEVFTGGYVNDMYDDWEFIYKDMQFYKDPDFCSVTAGKAVIGHVFQEYNYNGFEVILRVYDSEGDYWQTNWKWGGTSAANLVKLWRDVAVVSIWPSLPPYDDPTWYDWWFFDSTDYEIPGLDDPFWDSVLSDTVCDDFGLPHGSPASALGVWILVTGTNYGTVHENTKISLYAIYECDKVDYHSTPTFGYDKKKYTSMEYLGSYAPKKISANSGTGWGCIFWWMPTKTGFFKFIATIEIMDAISQDQDPSNNYFYLEAVVDNIGSAATYAGFMCDLDGSGKVGPRDFFIFARNYGKNVPPNP